MDGHRVDTVCVGRLESCLSPSLLPAYARVYLSSIHDFAACVSLATSRDNVLRLRTADYSASVYPALRVAQAVRVLAGQQKQLTCRIKRNSDGIHVRALVMKDLSVLSKNLGMSASVCVSELLSTLGL